MLELSIGLGILGGLLLFEFLGYSPGGFVTPGYLALFIDQPFRIVGTILISIITYVIILLLSRIMIIYGRRRFAITILISLVLGWLWSLLLSEFPLTSQELRVIGFIVPGLIANEMGRQGVAETVSSVIIVTAFVKVVTVTVGAAIYIL